MKWPRKPRPQAPDVCAELWEDDGVDPRKFFKVAARRNDRKLLQLCKQVQRSLSFLLGSECRDRVLQELEVISVSPAPDSSRLLVSVRAAKPGQQFSRDVLLETLKRAQPWLRTEVAAVVSRKRAPELVFEVCPYEEGNP